MGDDAIDANSQECTMVETHTVLVETTLHTSEEERLARAVAAVTCADDCFVARRSTTLLRTSDPHYMERLFPHLLPFGVGGLSFNRNHRYSARAIVLHYLNLSTNRFAEDPLFKLVMFDYLATARVKNSMFLRVGREPALASTIMRVSPQELKTAMQNRVDQRRAWKLGRSFTPCPESSTAAHCLQSINASAAKMWGSNEERESMARKVDAMTIKFGAPSIFWTLTPNPDCSIACAFWTCKPLPGGRPSRLRQCSAFNMPCASEMSRIVMANTMVQAEYYKVCCHILIDILFGWDSNVNKPKSQRGIFGYAEGLVYALEQQGRLFIHHHGVAWIAGLPRTQADWNTLRTNEQLRKRFEQYCTSIFSAELPVYDVLESIPCPQPGCDGELSSIPIHKKFKHRLKSTVAPPLVATCSTCNTSFKERDVINNIIDAQWNALDEESKAASSDKAVDEIRLRFGGLSPDPATSRVQLSRLLLKDQIHSFTHTSSCIKGRSGTKCRYNFFRKLISSTELNNNDEIQYRRRIGNQWLNTYVPTWRRVFHFNMDARVLLSGESLQASRYAIQYTVKRQSVLDNVAVVEMAFRKRVEREAGLESSEYGKGVGRLLSLAYSASGVMEIGGPLATAILLAGEAVIFSCSFERLVLLEGLSMLKNMPVEATVVSRNHALYAESTIGKYMARPSCLENVCWYDFCSWFSRDGHDTTPRVTSCTFVSANPQELRAHVIKHGYRYHDYPRVPELIGPQLPDCTRLEHEDYADRTELYYRIAMLLYRPFRDPRALLCGGESAKRCFQDWSTHINTDTKAALARHQHYYDCLRTAQEYRERQKNSTSEDSDDEDVCLDDDVVQHTHTRSQRESRSEVDYVTLPGELYTEEDDIDFDGDNVVPTLQGDEPTPMDELLLHSISRSELPVDNTLQFTANPSPIHRNQIASLQHNTCAPSQQSNIHQANQSTNVVIEAFSHAIRSIKYDRSTAPPQEITAYASIRVVSNYFNLNYKQHVAFALIATPLLSKIVGIPLDSREAKLFNNDPIIITGAGGTGKSRIVAAVRALVNAWGRPDAVKVVASTGIAAASLSGTTMHASVNLGPHAKLLPKHITRPSDALLQAWGPTLCVIADELSMINLAFFGLWEEALGYIKESRKAQFGGMIMVLMFDHCQLKTVSGTPLYKPGGALASSTPSEEHGRNLYQAITKCVYLTDNMRFAQDPQWGEWLACGRLGDWKTELRTFIASLPYSDCQRLPRDHNCIQTISTDNITRCYVNHAAINIAIRTLQPERRVYVILPRLSRPVSVEELALLRLLPDNKTGSIPLFLHLYIGMPVRIKANQCVAMGVANGASGEIYHIDWNPQNEFTIQPNGAWMASTHPINIYVKLGNYTSSTRFPGLPSHWPASVMPILQITESIKWSGSSLSIKGFPIVPAFGTTVHGIQGETRAAIAVTHLRPPHVHRVDPHALYVALSRLRTRDGLHWINQRPTKEDYDFFHPNADVINEDRRLQRISDSTIAAFHEITSNSFHPAL